MRDTMKSRAVRRWGAAAGDQQHHVIGYDVAGAGNGWLAITRLDGKLQKKLDLIRF